MNSEIDLSEGADMPNGRAWENDIAVGFYAKPSMSCLAIHVLSIARHAAGIRYATHYNSSATPFFIDLADLPSHRIRSSFGSDTSILTSSVGDVARTLASV